LFTTARLKDKGKALLHMIAWSKAAHQTPPGKDAGGTTINPLAFKMAVSAVDITFFIYSSR